jgi:hypothetical protein
MIGLPPLFFKDGIKPKGFTTMRESASKGPYILPHNLFADPAQANALLLAGAGVVYLDKPEEGSVP